MALASPVCVGECAGKVCEGTSTLESVTRLRLLLLDPLIATARRTRLCRAAGSDAGMPAALLAEAPRTPAHQDSRNSMWGRAIQAATSPQYQSLQPICSLPASKGAGCNQHLSRITRPVVGLVVWGVMSVCLKHEDPSGWSHGGLLSDVCTASRTHS